MSDKRILLHICCAPCSIEVINSLEKAGYDIFGYFYNPNVHPFKEYLERQKSVINYLDKCGYKYEIGDYDIYKYFKSIGEDIHSDKRCESCYRLRLEESARKAIELKYNTYSSTLLWNPHKDYEIISNIGKLYAKKSELNFVFPELTHDYWKYKEMAKKEEMYIQKYCGCVFSSYENNKNR